jgi:hypothetical protein
VLLLQTHVHQAITVAYYQLTLTQKRFSLNYVYFVTIHLSRSMDQHTRTEECDCVKDSQEDQDSIQGCKGV